MKKIIALILAICIFTSFSAFSFAEPNSPYVVANLSVGYGGGFSFGSYSNSYESVSPTSAPSNNTDKSSDPSMLSVGSHGEDVKTLQKALIEKGFLNAGGADGDYGNGTAKAVSAFQKYAGLPETGIADELTQRVLLFNEAPAEAQCKISGHKWQDATCTSPKTCSVCGKTEGSELGHDWIDATFSAPKTCSRCGITSGDPLSIISIVQHESNIDLDTFERKIKTLFSDAKGSIQEKVDSDGNILFDGTINIAFSSYQVTGVASDNRLLYGFSYIIPVSESSRLEYFDTLSLSKLKSDMKNYASIPMWRVTADSFLLAYGNLMAILSGETKNDDYYGMEVLLSSKSNPKVINNWEYSFYTETYLDGSGAVVITALYKG